MLRPEEVRRPWTVSELALEIRRELRPLSTVLVKGEVSGMKRSARGHYGFTVRDQGAAIEAFLFADDARRLPMVPEDGQEFVFRGRIDFWAQGGRLRLIVDYVEFDDAGKMRARLEQLKTKLELEGAFEAARKRQLPFLPRSVALITSPTGAVIHDLQETILDRFPNIEILVYPAQVQGTASPASVAGALGRCNREGRAQVAVIARGGGSFEELYAFNTEVVARAILNSRLPVVTALGHTSDRTIADLVADAECRTPTEAGGRVVPRKADLQAGLVERSRRLEREVSNRLRAAGERLAQRSQALRRAVPALVQRRTERLERSRAALARLSPEQQLARRGELLARQRARLEALAAAQVKARLNQLVGRQAGERLVTLLERRLRDAQADVAQRRQRLLALSPEAVLARGYSITLALPDRQVLRSARQVEPGRDIEIRLAEGSLSARVEAKHP
jgi:exodeoxyribonuclease VII large subunit